MAWRYHGRAEVNPDSPRAWAVCDRCGWMYNLYKLQWQHQYAGFQLINLRILVCSDCLDKPAPFLKALVLPPDPPPLYNVRPEPYTVDEQGPTQQLIAELELGTSTITTLFLDIFDGDPTDGGTSALSTLTGSETRTDFASSMGAVSDLVSNNTSTITLVTIAETSANITWLAAYDAATGGNLLAASQILPQTVVMGNGVALAVGALRVQVQP